jgi:hypothetical protein
LLREAIAEKLAQPIAPEPVSPLDAAREVVAEEALPTAQERQGVPA